MFQLLRCPGVSSNWTSQACTAEQIGGGGGKGSLRFLAPTAYPVGEEAPADYGWPVSQSGPPVIPPVPPFMSICSVLSRLLLLFPSLLTIPLARQCFFYPAALTGLQVEGVTLYFFDNIFLLNLAFKSTQRIFKRLALLHANFCQDPDTSQSPQMGQSRLRYF
jgi:hypothetical protein